MLLALLIVVATAAAWRMRWVCDDIFITYRYVDQLLAGSGAVFNPGEHVEGYSHLLWFALLAIGQWLGLDARPASMMLGVLSYALVLGLWSVIGWKVRTRHVPFLAYTVLALVLNRDFMIWATSGLETMFVTLLLSAGFHAAHFSTASARRRLFLAGTWLILAALTRPDAALFYALGAFLAAGRALLFRHGLRAFALDALAYSVPFFVLYVPWFAWKLHYYGHVFPNTYYAKAAYDSQWGQGFYYIGLYFRVLYPEYFQDEESPLGDWGRKALMTLKGYTEFNVPIWFLICLFTLEFYHYVAVRVLSSPGRIALAISLFFAAGSLATR
ncbi:hypothetical protein HZA57_10400, partial [Candidatus Poribacteria bacterium]|nr:hypothetical protein [Candidatus Poribacteria bacterium]